DTAMQMLATKNAATGMMGAAVMANQWIPIVKALMVSVAFCMIPLLALFVPTPLFPKALMATFGFFLWITVWGIIDATLHQFAVNYASTAFSQIKQYNLGVTSVMNFSTVAGKTLAAFGTIRWAGLTLATVMVGMLVKFGGAALAQLSGSVTGHVEGAGTKAGHQIMTPEGRAQTLSNLEMAPAVMANAQRWDYQTRTDARTFDGMSRMGGSIQTMGELGGHRAGADQMANAQTINNRQRIGATNQYENGDRASELAGINENKKIGGAGEYKNGKQARETGAKKEEQTIGAMEQYKNPAEAGHIAGVKENANIGQTKQTEAASLGFGRNIGFQGTDGDVIQKMAAFEKGGRIINDQQAASLNDAYHSDAFKSGMKLEYQTNADGKGFNVKGTRQTGKEKVAGHTVGAGALETAFAGQGGARHTYQGTIDGKEGTLSIQDGKPIFTSGKSGTDKAAMDRDVVLSNRGVEIASSTALQRVLKNDSSLIADSGLTKAKTAAEEHAAIAAIVAPLGNAIAPFESRTGTSEDHSRADANMSASVGTPGISPVQASIGGQASVGGSRTDMKQTNLVNQQLEQTLHKAKEEAAVKNLKGQDADKYVMGKLHDHVYNMAEEHVKNNPEKFGASTGPEAVKEKANEWLGKLGG
ncbi:MAG: conjugal transfer protein TraG N-terminal domain-containing protein, partial [Legionellales bacterium]